jgi:PhnB protein
VNDGAGPASGPGRRSRPANGAEGRGEDHEFLGADVADRYEAPKGFALSVQISNTAEAERIFAALAKGGRVVVPLEKTFRAARFGQLVDPFGQPWLINCEAEV